MSDSVGVCGRVRLKARPLFQIDTYFGSGHPPPSDSLEACTTSLDTMRGLLATTLALGVLLASTASAVVCPPASFDALPGLDFDEYIRAPWFVQAQVGGPLQRI